MAWSILSTYTMAYAMLPAFIPCGGNVIIARGRGEGDVRIYNFSERFKAEGHTFYVIWWYGKVSHPDWYQVVTMITLGMLDKYVSLPALVIYM